MLSSSRTAVKLPDRLGTEGVALGTKLESDRLIVAITGLVGLCLREY